MRQLMAFPKPAPLHDPSKVCCAPAESKPGLVAGADMGAVLMLGDEVLAWGFARTLLQPDGVQVLPPG